LEARIETFLLNFYEHLQAEKVAARTQLAQAVHTEFEQWAADFVAETAALNRDMLAQQRAVWGAAEPPPQVKKKKAARTSLPKYSTCFTAGVYLLQCRLLRSKRRLSTSLTSIREIVCVHACRTSRTTF